MLTDPIHGFARLELAHIMQNLELEFGTMTEKDIVAACAVQDQERTWILMLAIRGYEC